MDRFIEPGCLIDRRREINNRLSSFVEQSGYPLTDFDTFRKIGPLTLFEQCEPERGSEIFVNGLPRDAIEDEIFEFFSQVGTIFDMRLMVTDSGIYNLGYAFVRFLNPDQAKKAITLLDRKYFRNSQVTVQKSMENNCLYICGLPTLKTKIQIWNELIFRGVDGITDVIVYKSQNDVKKNRGFVFVEFENHDVALNVRQKYQNDVLCLFGKTVLVDWSISTTKIDPDIMARVTRLFLRNLPIEMSPRYFMRLISRIVDANTIEKVYKKEGYAFVHFVNRNIAEQALIKLKHYFKETEIEIVWSNPPEEARKIETINFQQHKVLKSLFREESNRNNFTPTPTSWANLNDESEIWPTRTDIIYTRNTISASVSFDDHQQPVVEELENLFHFPSWWDVLEAEQLKGRKSVEGDSSDGGHCSNDSWKFSN